MNQFYIIKEKAIGEVLGKMLGLLAKQLFLFKLVELLICIEILRSEMEYAMEYGSKELFKLLKDGGYYPYSDLDRLPVV